MGANVSKSVQKVREVIENTSKTACVNDANITQSIKGLNVHLKGLSCGELLVANKASIAQTCDMNAISNALAQASMGASKEQLATLGLAVNVSDSVQDRESNIKNIIEAKCGSSARVQQNIEGVTMVVEPWESSTGEILKPDCDTLKFLNDANVTQQCIMKTVMDSVSQTKQEVKDKQTVKFPIGITIGIGLGVVGFIVIAVVIGMLIKNSGKKKATTTATKATTAKTSTTSTVGATISGPDTALQVGGGYEINLKNAPITVMGIMMLVWYAKMTDNK